MRVYKVGDRVRLCGFGTVGGESSDVEDCKASVVKVEHSGRVVVKPDKKDWEVSVYPSQCRRIRKVKPREFWLTQDNLGPEIKDATVWHKDPRSNQGWAEEWEVIHVREVLNK